LKKKKWSHIELGASNYAENVHGDRTHTAKGNLSDNQYNVLFKTTDELIADKGKSGVIYINDLDEQMVKYTIDCLRNYITKTYPDNEIELRSLVGDFFKIDIPQVTSIHLKNPEIWFFDSFAKFNMNRLHYFADHSSEGLTFVTYFKSDFLKLVNKLGLDYKIINNDYYPYIHADGSTIKSHGNVVQYSITSPGIMNLLHFQLHGSSSKDNSAQNQFK
jgi:hypothetical protein